MRTTVAKHTADIAHIEALLEDCESTDEESSFSGESSAPEPGSGDPPAATPQDQEEEEEHDIEMRDVENDPNPPPSEQDDNPPPVPTSQTDPPPEDNGDNSRSDKDILIEDERIVIETGGATPITLADDRLLDQDDQEEGTGAKTPSGVVTESLSQMNMDSPATTLIANDPSGGIQDT